MPSPFPGMDPYLEAPWIWPDLHLTLIVAIRAELNRLLPAHYVASADRYVWLQEPTDTPPNRFGKPDVYVTGEGGSPAAALTTAAPPVKVVLAGLREKGPPYLKIIDRERRRLVTVLELLSPANKTPGKDRDAYLWKRSEYLGTGVNLVELDLLRDGVRAPLGKPGPPAADYYLLMCRAAEMPEAGVWPFSVRDPLPPIPFPLKPQDNDVLLPLQSCLDRAYDEAGYARELNYAEPPVPPLREPDATWARERLAARLPQPSTPPQGEHQ